MPEILKHPEQLVIEWLPEHLAERQVRKNGVILQKKVVGYNVATHEPVYHYLVRFPRPRYIFK